MKRWDNNGIQLADVPNAGVSRVAAGQRSGNKLHDARSGKFGQGSGPAPKPRGTPAPNTNVDPLQYKRMLDAVREAAREFDNPQEGDIRDFIKGRANSPDQVDIQGFLDQVNEQRKADLVDILDSSFRSSGALSRGRRKVKVSAPKGYVRRLLRTLDSDSLAEVMHRLESMGHSRADLDQFFSSRTPTHEQAAPKRDAIAAAENQSWAAETLSFDGPLEDLDETQEEMLIRFADVFKAMPAPVINVEVNIPPKPDDA